MQQADGRGDRTRPGPKDSIGIPRPLLLYKGHATKKNRKKQFFCPTSDSARDKKWPFLPLILFRENSHQSTGKIRNSSCAIENLCCPMCHCFIFSNPLLLLTWDSVKWLSLGPPPRSSFYNWPFYPDPKQSTGLHPQPHSLLSVPNPCPRNLEQEAATPSRNPLKSIIEPWNGVESALHLFDLRSTLSV